MKTIMVADWYLLGISYLLSAGTKALHRDFRFVQADDMEEATALMAGLKPNSVIR
jgi:hypothetical protein